MLSTPTPQHVVEPETARVTLDADSSDAVKRNYLVCVQKHLEFFAGDLSQSLVLFCNTSIFSYRMAFLSETNDMGTPCSPCFTLDSRTTA